MALRCTSVIRGKRKPLLVDLTSSIAELSAELPVILIAAPCEKANWVARVFRNNTTSNFLMLFFNIFLISVLNQKVVIAYVLCKDNELWPLIGIRKHNSV